MKAQIAHYTALCKNNKQKMPNLHTHMLESSSFENKINIMRLKTQTFYSRESFVINFKEFMNERM